MEMQVFVSGSNMKVIVIRRVVKSGFYDLLKKGIVEKKSFKVCWEKG